MSNAPLRAGRLKERVLIQAPAGTSDGQGGRTKTWTDIEEVWAEIIPLRGDEALASGIQRGSQFYRVTIRRRNDVTPKHRLMWGTVPMNIRAAAKNVLGDGTVMTAESGVLT